MYLRARNPATIPQSQPLNERQSKNAAGGYAYTVDRWDQLDRFLIIGTQGGTYYVGQDKLTQECTDLVNALLLEDGQRVVRRALEISLGGRAVKQDFALYAIALAIALESPLVKHPTGVETRSELWQKYEQTVRQGYKAIPQVCRTASTLFQLVSYLKHRKGWSRGLRNAIAAWYNRKPVGKLAYQMVKYQRRNEYSHRDLLRLAHVNPNAVYFGEDYHAHTPEDGALRNSLYRWAVGKQPEGDMPRIVQDLERTKAPEADRAFLASRLPREALPTEWLNDPAVWKALLMGDVENEGRGMPLFAMLRNLGNMSKAGLLVADSDAARYVCGELRNDSRLAEARMHPISILLALKTYASGRGYRGKGTWAPVGQVIDALNDAFIRSFRFIPKSDKKVLVAIDVSGSMVHASVGDTNLQAFEVAAAMSMAHLRQFEASYTVFATGWEQFQIARDDTVERMVNRLARYNGGGTDLGQAIIAAQAHVAPFDAIIIYTDSETWAGRHHLDVYLQEYRRTRNANVKLVIAATTATGTSVGDPRDSSILQAVGFDGSVPQVIGEFVG